MRLAVIWVAPLTGAPNVSPGRLAEIIAWYAIATDRMEHITVREQFHRLAVFGFFLADSSQDARQKLTRLARTAAANEPALAYWRVI